MAGFDIVSRTEIDSVLKSSSVVLASLGVEVPSDLDSAKIMTELSKLSGSAHESDSHERNSEEKDHHEADHKEDSEHSEGHHAEHKIVVTHPQVIDITLEQPYVCQIHSRRHIEVCALEKGYLQEILVKEGQRVKKGDLLFKILPTLYQARLDAEMAEAKLAELEFNYTKTLADKNVVSQNEVMLLEAKLAKARANAQMAKAELDFTNIVAPFDGIVDRLHEQLGSLISEGDMLTTLSDNSVMWVYFNVPEAAYLDYMETIDKKNEEERIELVLANGKKFQQPGKIGAIEAKFNNQTGNIPFRADFPNPDGILRHGQTGTIMISKVHKDAIVIPQRATFEILDKRYVFVVDEENVVHQRLIKVEHEKDDIFIVASGITSMDKIVLDGVRDMNEGKKIEFEVAKPEQVLAHQKFHAE
ncbi:efflux RND transporter periplasmic adaptor subunit [bacterium]|nr:efflux RND transporter periplasmic adaptor subunit [bacterium]